MYEELIKELRDYAAARKGEIAELASDAADAIEELQGQIDGWIEQERKAMLKSMPKWIPVTERLPEDLQNVLVIDDGRVAIGHCEHYYGEERVYVEWHDMLYYPIDPPYWMPLPEPPKEETV